MPKKETLVAHTHPPSPSKFTPFCFESLVQYISLSTDRRSLLCKRPVVAHTWHDRLALCDVMLWLLYIYIYICNMMWCLEFYIYTYTYAMWCDALNFIYMHIHMQCDVMPWILYIYIYIAPKSHHIAPKSHHIAPNCTPSHHILTLVALYLLLRSKETRIYDKKRIKETYLRAYLTWEASALDALYLLLRSKETRIYEKKRIKETYLLAYLTWEASAFEHGKICCVVFALDLEEKVRGTCCGSSGVDI